MKQFIEFLKECDFEDIIAFPLLAGNIILLWLLAFAVGCK